MGQRRQEVPAVASGATVHSTGGPFPKRQEPHFSKLSSRAPRRNPANQGPSKPARPSAMPMRRKRVRTSMSVGLTAATTSFMGDTYTFIDCPGSVEFIHDMRAALPAVDAAVVVCEADERKLPQLQLILRELEDLEHSALPVPQQDRHAPTSACARRSPRCSRPRACRWCCARSRSGTAIIVAGFVDLALERALRLSRALCLPKSSRWRAAISIARRRRASRCWRSLPTTTMR